MVGLKKIEVYGLMKEAEFYQAKFIAEVGVNLTRKSFFSALLKQLLVGKGMFRVNHFYFF